MSSDIEHRKLTRSQIALQALPVLDTERKEILAFIQKFEPADGLVTICAREIIDALSLHRPEVTPAYKHFSKAFPIRSPFSFMPLDELMLRVFCASKLLNPGIPLWEAVYRLLLLSMETVFDNPAMQIMYRTAGGNINMFLELTMSGDDRIGNYIKKRDFRVIRRNCVEIQYVGSYPHMDDVLNPPYAESIFKRFKVIGTSICEKIGPRESLLTLCW